MVSAPSLAVLCYNELEEVKTPLVKMDLQAWAGGLSAVAPALLQQENHGRPLRGAAGEQAACSRETGRTETCASNRETHEPGHHLEEQVGTDRRTDAGKSNPPVWGRLSLLTPRITFLTSKARSVLL